MILQLGDANDQVTQVQLLMKALGYDIPASGIYDAALQAAVADWQARTGIPASGVWDPQTHGETVARLAQPNGGAGQPLMIPPRQTAGMDLEQWGIQRDMDRYADPEGRMPRSDNIDGFAFLEQTLKYYGLSDLSDWAIGLLQKGTSEDEILLLLEDQPQFKARFPYNNLIRNQGDPMIKSYSPEEWMRWEQELRSLFQNAGFPEGFYDGPEDFKALALAGKSAVEIQEQINDGYKRVKDAHPSVREAFRDYFGIQGDVALGLLFIDPERAPSTLTQMAEQATVAASARRMDFSLSKPLVEEMIKVGITEQDSSQIFGQMDQIRGLFREGIGDKEDLDVEGALRSQTGLSGGQATELEARRQRRLGRGSGAGGGFDLEQGLQVGKANE